LQGLTIQYAGPDEDLMRPKPSFSLSLKEVTAPDEIMGLLALNLSWWKTGFAAIAGLLFPQTRHRRNSSHNGQPNSTMGWRLLS
jgi:hypothetical protein